MIDVWACMFDLVFHGVAYVLNSFNELFCLSVAFSFVIFIMNLLRQLLYRRVGE